MHFKSKTIKFSHACSAVTFKVQELKCTGVINALMDIYRMEILITSATEVSVAFMWIGVMKSRFKRYVLFPMMKVNSKSGSCFELYFAAKLIVRFSGIKEI